MTSFSKERHTRCLGVKLASVNQQADDNKKWATDKEVPAGPNDPDRKLHIHTGLEAK
jgi:hypothetical protein